MTKFSFDEAIEYVKALDVYGSVLGLDNMHALARELDNPEDGLKFVHVTGTNGKGSVCAFLSNILMQGGYKVGAYNSPAVLGDTDQFSINMKTIEKSLYAEAVSLVKDACDRITAAGGIQPTRFEVETMTAFVAFYIEGCDIVVLETGLGGRDDATNIVKNTLLHIFTSISLDHSAVLGNTLEEIADVKSGIIKTSAPVIMYEKRDCSYKSVIARKCIEMGADLHPVKKDCVSRLRVTDDSLIFDICMQDELDEEDPIELRDVTIKMKGAYQPVNAAIAIKAAYALKKQGMNITEVDVLKGLSEAEIPFRFEIINGRDDVLLILDGAHNPDGATKLRDSLMLNFKGRKFIFITGIFKDKDYEQICKITGGIAEKVYAVENTDSERALPKEMLGAVLKKYNDYVEIIDDIGAAVGCALQDADSIIDTDGNHPIVVCFGSLSWLRKVKADKYK